MVLAVLSDIHGNPDALRSVLEDLPPETDRLLFLGDLAGYYPFVGECLDLLEGWETVRVAGNHDLVLARCMEEERAPPPSYEDQYGTALRRSMANLSPNDAARWTQAPPDRTLDLDGVACLLCHGAPWDPVEGRVYPDFDRWDRFDGTAKDLVLLGHTHHPLLHRRERVTVLNPGSVGQPRDRSASASYALLDGETGQAEHRRVPFDPARLIEDARRHDPEHPYLVEVLTR